VRKNHGTLSKKMDELSEIEKKINTGYSNQLAKLEKSQIETQYTKSLLLLKCNFLKIET
jgi:hypothetical protein